MTTHDKVAVITGGGTGIGKACALAFVNDGYRVVISGRRAEPLDETIKEAGVDGSRMIGVPTDVGDPAAVKNLFAKTMAAFGRVDVLFNNAGTNAPGVLFEELPWEKWKAVVDANLNGMFLCSQETYKIMKNQTPRDGRIINNGSISAHVPRPDSAPTPPPNTACRASRAPSRSTAANTTSPAARWTWATPCRRWHRAWPRA